MKTIGQNIRQARLNAGLSVKELFQKTGIKPGAIYCYERDHTTPGLFNFYSLAKVLNVSMDELMESLKEPAHIDREAWNCTLCKDAKFVIGKAYSETHVEKGHICSVCFSDEGSECDFYYCPKCGRPLTEEAWSELEKRLNAK